MTEHTDGAARSPRHPPAVLAEPGVAAVAVAADGAVHEIAGVRADPLLLHEAELHGYARAFLRSGRRRFAFRWRDAAGDWHLVELRATTAPGGEARALLSARAEALPHGLTPRELDVVTLVTAGLSNPEIAARLVVSPRTAGTHVEHVLAKLGQRTRAGAAAQAAEEGLVRLPAPVAPGAAPTDDADRFLLGGPVRPARTAAVLAARRRPFLIGSAFPLTGPAAADGSEMRDGSALAISEINAAGGIAGRRLEQLVVDCDVFTEAGVRAGLEQLFAADIDALLLGYVFAERTSCDLAADYGAPFLNTAAYEAQAQWVREDPERYGAVFQVCPTEKHYGTGFIRFLDELVAQRRWRPPNRRLLSVEGPFLSAQVLHEDALTAAERSGWDLEGTERLPALGADWQGVLDRIRRTAPAAVLVSHVVPAELAAFQRAFAADPTDTLVYCVYGPSVPEYLELAGEAAEGVVWATTTGTYDDPIGREFRERYTARYGRRPGHSMSGLSYDQVHLLARAWSRSSGPGDTAGTAQELRRMVHRGVNGSYWFGDAGQCGLAYPEATPDPSLGQAHLCFQVQGGRHRIVSPAPYADSAFVAPPWTGGAPPRLAAA